MASMVCSNRSLVVRDRLKRLMRRKCIPTDDYARALLFCRFLGLPSALANPALLYHIFGHDKTYFAFLALPTKEQRRTFVCSEAIRLKHLRPNSQSITRRVSNG